MPISHIPDMFANDDNYSCTVARHLTIVDTSITPRLAWLFRLELCGLAIRESHELDPVGWRHASGFLAGTTDISAVNPLIPTDVIWVQL